MRIGIIGAGMIGSTLGRLWVKAGHRVILSSRHPDDLQPLTDSLGVRAWAGSPKEAATFGEVIVMAVPVEAIPDLARDLSRFLAGKVVLDPTDASAGWAAAMFPGSRWVKAFNGVPPAGDDAEALDIASRLMHDAGLVP